MIPGAVAAALKGAYKDASGAVASRDADSDDEHAAAGSVPPSASFSIQRDDESGSESEITSESSFDAINPADLGSDSDAETAEADVAAHIGLEASRRLSMAPTGTTYRITIDTSANPTAGSDARAHLRVVGDKGAWEGDLPSLRCGATCSAL